MKVNEHSAYKKARLFANIIWRLSKNWDMGTQKTLGNQLIRSTDSISANLAEGWNRYSKKDKISFYIISRSSLAETIDWIEKAFERGIISKTLLSRD